MFVKGRAIAFPLVSVVSFFLLGFITDRDLFRYPLVTRGGGEDRERGALVETLKTYNKMFNDFYASDGRPSLLNEFPGTTAMRHGIFRDIGYLRDAGRVLVYDMAALTPVEVKVTSPRTAEAVVLEQWNYQYQRRDNRKPLSRIKGGAIGIRYFLVRQGGQWVVNAWTPVSVEEPDIAEFPG
ncbi:MAG: hypothetical protein OHK006_06300 [Thermodesulfovibrionales bacterium]